MHADALSGAGMCTLSGFEATTYKWNAIMKRNLVTSSLLGAVALAISTAAALAQPSNLDSSQPRLSAAGNPLVLVRGGGGGGHGGGGGGGHGFGGGHGGGFGGGHGMHGSHFRGGFSAFGGPYYDDYYGEGCWWSARYRRTVCY